MGFGLPKLPGLDGSGGMGIPGPDGGPIWRPTKDNKWPSELGSNPLGGKNLGDTVRSITDATGLTDFKEAEEARQRAQSREDKIDARADEMWNYWKDNMAPYQQEIMQRMSGLYDEAGFSDDDYANALGKTNSDIITSFAKARERTKREMDRYGVKPGSGKWDAMNREFGINEAATTAAERNKVRGNMRDVEFGRKAQALGLGGQAGNYASGAPGMAMSGYGNAMNNATGMFSNMYNQSHTGMRQLQQQQHDMANEFLQNMMGGMGGGMGGFADGGENRGFGLQLEGEVIGPGTPISDSIPVPADGGVKRLADGEVVLPTDTVASFGLRMIETNPEAAAHKLGVKILEEKIDATHVPAAEQAQFGLSIDPRPAIDGEYEVEGMADGGMSRGKIALFNGLSGGKFLENQRKFAADRRAEEEQEWRREERERQNAMREDMNKAFLDASTTQFNDADTFDPEFGLEAAYGGEGKEMGFGLRNEGEFDPARYKKGITTAMAKHDPIGYLNSAGKGKAIKLGINDRLIDPLTNDVLVDADPVAKRGGGKAASAIQLAEYLKQDPRYRHLGEGQLVELAKASYSDPISAASSLLSNDRDYRRSDPVTKERMFNATLEMFTKARRNAYGVGDEAETKDAPAQQAAASYPTATNPKTGEKLIYKDGQWISAE